MLKEGRKDIVESSAWSRLGRGCGEWREVVVGDGGKSLRRMDESVVEGNLQSTLVEGSKLG